MSPTRTKIRALLAQGLPNKIIARKAGVAPSTVKYHVAVILAELGAASRVQAAEVLRRHG